MSNKNKKINNKNNENIKKNDINKDKSQAKKEIIKKNQKDKKQIEKMKKTYEFLFSLGLVCGIIFIVILVVIFSPKHSTSTDIEPSGEVAESEDNNNSSTLSPDMGLENEIDYSIYVNTNNATDLSYFTKTSNKDAQSGSLMVIQCKEDFERFIENNNINPKKEELYFRNNLTNQEYSSFFYLACIDSYENEYIEREFNHITVENNVLHIYFDKSTQVEESEQSSGYWTYLIKIPRSELDEVDLSTVKYKIVIQ